MNKLLIPPGGMPFEGDDLLFMQEAFRSGFAMLSEAFSNTSAFNDNSCILKGVNLSVGGGNVSYSTGTCFIAGELCMLASGVAVGAEGALNQWWIELEAFPDPAGTQIFADAVSKDTYEIRRAKVTNSATIPSDGAMRFDLLDSYKVTHTWTPAAFLNGIMQESLDPVIVRKNHRYVTFSGSIMSSGSTVTGSEIFTIPTYFRPSTSKVFLATGNQLLFILTVNAADGKVRIYNQTSSQPDPLDMGVVNLCVIHYPIN